jgi:hypothetical protein
LSRRTLLPACLQALFLLCKVVLRANPLGPTPPHPAIPTAPQPADPRLPAAPPIAGVRPDARPAPGPAPGPERAGVEQAPARAAQGGQNAPQAAATREHSKVNMPHASLRGSAQNADTGAASPLSHRRGDGLARGAEGSGDAAEKSEAKETKAWQAALGAGGSGEAGLSASGAAAQGGDARARWNGASDIREVATEVSLMQASPRANSF